MKNKRVLVVDDNAINRTKLIIVTSCGMRGDAARAQKTGL
jgi:hypothetical protein